MTNARQANQAERNTPSSRPLTIDYDRFKTDRRISRPPGVPTVWSKPSIPRTSTFAAASPQPPRPASRLSSNDTFPTILRSTQDNLAEDDTKEFNSSDGQVKVEDRVVPPEPLLGSLDQTLEEVQQIDAFNSSKQEKTRKQIPQDQEPRKQIPQEKTREQDPQEKTRKQSQQEKTRAQIHKSSKTQDHASRDVIESKDHKKKPRPYERNLLSSNTKIENNYSREIKTMSIEELDLRHKEALRKMQQRSVNHQGGSNIDKAQLRKKYEEEIERLRANMKHDQTRGRLSGRKPEAPDGTNAAPAGQGTSFFKQMGVSHPHRPVGKMESNSRDNPPNPSNQSRGKSWFNY
ncbi:hypothetical protein PCASD_00347 [Puccinia coronata f. sp. avenae]|uniref:Uncharacterized protein n=1 Tax=Puccinia coronata f. sp. avenae TaxID=200324 RepID=A0A2N5VNA8_9BASI|nr:hypothetical protein PCASD_00347 [Puccinia coronata f. sp. avenae]